MINLKTLIKTVYRGSRYFYHQGVNGTMYLQTLKLFSLKKIHIKNYVKFFLIM